MKPRLYVETTIPSYLTGRPTRDLVVSARQEVTREWWERRRRKFDLYISQGVLDEVSEGDSEAVVRRLAVLQGLPLLAINADVTTLAKDLIRSGALPEKATRDAAHIAVAAVHEMRFLLTWNRRHLANAEIFEDIARVCATSGFRCPIICTPDELLGEEP